MYSSDAVKYTQLRFQPDGVFQKTMKTMDKAARLAMLPDCEKFCVDLKVFSELDGENTLKFYFVDLLDAVIIIQCDSKYARSYS